MELYFNDKDQLYFDGYDIGKTVEEIWGDSDFEYTHTIEPEEVNKIYKIFNLKTGDKKGLLQILEKKFSNNNAYFAFREFMQLHNIKFNSFTWS